MLKRTSRVGKVLIALILVASIFAVTGCGGKPKLKGKKVIIASWSGAYNVDTYEPRHEEEANTLEYRRKMLADNGLHMEVVELSGWDDYFQNVVNNIMSGNKEYGIYCVAAEWAVTLYKQGLLFPLSDSSVKLDNRVAVAYEKTAYNKMMEDLFTLNGKRYGVFPGEGGDSWHGIFVHWNKRLFREAGLDPDLPFNLQRDGLWTWDAFYEIAKQVTRDINNNGITDVYGLACDDARELLTALVIGNNGNWVNIENGKYTNGTTKPEFLEAMAFYQRLINEGLMKTRPPNPAWDWEYTEFVDGRIAMVFGAEWRAWTSQGMDDDWGAVLPPKGPRATSYRMATDEMIYVVPSFFSKAEVDTILSAFDLWNVPTDTDWKQGYYAAYRDRRSVDETMALTKTAGNTGFKNYTMVPGYPMGDLIMDQGVNWWEAGTPSQIAESWAPRLQSVLDDANR